MSRKNNIALIEGVSPVGHVRLTSFYIENMIKTGDLVFVGSSLKDSYSVLEQIDINFFDDSNLLSGRLSRAIAFVSNSIKQLHTARNKKIKDVVFLSYDPMLFFIVSFYAYLLRINLYSFEHNTVPLTKVKNCFQALCIGVTRFCFSGPANKRFQKLGIASHFIPHPLIRSKLENDTDMFLSYREHYKAIVFCPSASADINDIIRAADRYPNLMFYVKTDLEVNKDNVLTFQFLDNYEAVMQSCDFVFIPVAFEYRVSGPAFEAIAFGKKVILNHCSFRKELQKNFKDNVFESEKNWDEMDNLTGNTELSSYNDSIICALEGALDNG